MKKSYEKGGARTGGLCRRMDGTILFVKNTALRRQERRRTDPAVRAEGWHREKKAEA